MPPSKSVKILFIAISILTIWLVILLYFGRPNENSSNPDRKITWGATFSWSFAEKLGFDPKNVYLEILDDLKIKNLRLIAYWPEIEPESEKYVFDELDWQIQEAQKRDVKIIMAMGLKLPRWPECHEPEWIKNHELRIKNHELLNYIEKVVERYKDTPNLYAWQIENEPFLAFGECPKFDPEFLDEEIALVKSLDGRPIIITDSGELSLWYKAAKRADIFGTTMYRKVHAKITGYITYPLPAGFFRAKERLLKLFIAFKNPLIVIELQGEPWSEKLLYETAPEDDLKYLNIREFRDIIDYAKRAGFNEYYLWGAEWWYKMKQSGHSEFWEEIKDTIQQ